MEPNIVPEKASPEVKAENANLDNTPIVETVASQEVNLQVEQPSVAQAPVQQTVPIAVSDPTVQAPVMGQAQNQIVEETKQDAKDDKAWVKKTKEVIKEYKDDPYEEEEASELLQEEYLEERFKLKVDDKEQT